MNDKLMMSPPLMILQSDLDRLLEILSSELAAAPVAEQALSPVS